MNKPIVYIDCDETYPDDCVVTGYYFLAESDVSGAYIIEFAQMVDGSNVKATIFHGVNLDGVCNGDLCKILDTRGPICTVDIWGKHFHLEYGKSMQLYYDDKYYPQDKQLKTDSITGMAEAINYAIDLGFKKAGITPY